MCKGRLQLFYPIYLPQDSVLSKKVIVAEHKRSVYGGVAIAMSHVRSLVLIDPLRRSSRLVIRSCWGCKKFRSLPYCSQNPGPLLNDRTEKCFPFEVIGTDYAGPIYYKSKRKSELKAHISYYFTGAVHIELQSWAKYMRQTLVLM